MSTNSRHNVQGKSRDNSTDSVEGSSESLTPRWKLRLRPEDDDEPQDWWWASTAIPLLAATTGPLANMMSIAALVTSWRNTYPEGKAGVDDASIGYPDPKWCLGLNGASLACGCIGNIFLLLNFTRRVRYIVALPMTIVLWYFATSILIAITVSMNRFVPPKEGEVYSQGFWHAVIAAILYLLSSMALMVNMLGYFLGHYPQYFTLSEEQRNLILQTMMFFVWLAGGAGVFSKVEGWSYVDSLYFTDVTILTIGFGDFHPGSDAGRGLVFPFSVGGIIILGLVVSSIHGFAKELGSSHVVRNHAEKRRNQILDRSTTNEDTFERMQMDMRPHAVSKSISSPYDQRQLNSDLYSDGTDPVARHHKRSIKRHMRTGLSRLKNIRSREPKIILLRQEKSRFDAMRAIEQSTKRFKAYSALSMSIIAFGLLWCVGAVGFWQTEKRIQGMTYFQAIYLAYVSLLTIGYGDLAPQSNAGKPFFIVWSLIAVPTMTILVSDMGDTVIASFKRGTFKLADWTVLPKEGVWRELGQKFPRLRDWTQRRAAERMEHEAEREGQERIEKGFPTGPADEDVNDLGPTLEDVAALDNMDTHTLARKLVTSIRRVANELKLEEPKRYTYEQWAEYTRLIRFTRIDEEELGETEIDFGLIEWDWIGEDSPLLSGKTESEWLLDRLTESLQRFMFMQRKELMASDQKNGTRNEVELEDNNDG